MVKNLTLTFPSQILMSGSWSSSKKRRKGSANVEKGRKRRRLVESILVLLIFVWPDLNHQCYVYIHILFCSGNFSFLFNNSLNLLSWVQKEKVEDEEIEIDPDVAAMMGFGGFGSSKKWSLRACSMPLLKSEWFFSNCSHFIDQLHCMSRSI